MTSYRLNIIGLQVLLLVYTAQSFVLLSANVDDIKKLASKFLSESLADKLTGFVVQATQQMNQHMAEPQAVDKLKTSDAVNYELRNIARQGNSEEKTQKYIESNNQDKHKSYNQPNESKELLSVENDKDKDNERKWAELNKKIDERNAKQSKATKYWRDIIFDIKHKGTESNPSKKNYSLMEKNDISNNDYFSQEHLKHYGNQVGRDDDRDSERPKLYLFNREKETNFKESHNEFAEDHRKSTQRYYQDEKPKTENSKTRNSAESIPNKSRLIFDLHKAPKSNKNKHYSKNNHNYNLKPEINSNEFKESSDQLWKPNKFRSNDDTTTKKEKNDFDQYDNRNYPKAHFIATSGPVKLPRVAIAKRYEDKMNDEEDSQ